MASIHPSSPRPRFLSVLLERLAELHPRRFFLEPWYKINQDVFGKRGEKRPGAFDFRPLYVFAAVAISLVLQQYFGSRTTFRQIIAFICDVRNARSSPFWYFWVGWLEPFVRDIARPTGYWPLWQLGFWAFARVVGYVAIPLIVLRWLPGVKLRDLGLSFKGLKDHLWLYVVLFFPVLVAVVIVSFRSDFSNYYPMYNNPRGLSDLLIWEVLYFVQFLALEFFFRGFMLHPLKESMGAYSIFAMMVPYCMIHFGKPYLECFAAIIAGVVLGTLSLRTRSIWCGALIHMSVAISMDAASLIQTGRLRGLI